jgi:hypothetical protein
VSFCTFGQFPPREKDGVEIAPTAGCFTAFGFNESQEFKSPELSAYRSYILAGELSKTLAGRPGLGMFVVSMFSDGQKEK